MSLPTPSRGMIGYAGGFVAGALGAAVLAVALTHPYFPFVLLAYLASLPLLVVGLSAGLWACAIGAIVGSVGLFFAVPEHEDVIFFIFADALPAIILVALALRSEATVQGAPRFASEGSILAALVTYPCVLFLVVCALTAGHDGGLLGMTHEAFEGLSSQAPEMLKNYGVDATPDILLKFHQALDLMARIAPAMAMYAWLFSTMIVMVVAQGIVAQQKWLLRPAFSLVNLRIPGWIVFATAISGLLAYAAPLPFNYIGLNLACVLGVPFFLCGLAVIHAYAATTRATNLFLIVFYILITVIPHIGLLVALLGAVDQWVDFRKKFAERQLTE